MISTLLYSLKKKEKSKVPVTLVKPKLTHAHTLEHQETATSKPAYTVIRIY